MKIELRNIHYAKFASQETDCFEATVVIDGKVAGTVSNEGHGGNNMYHPFALEEILDGHAKTLPQLKTQYGNLDMSADLVIGNLFTEWIAAKELKRLFKRYVLFTKGGKLYQRKVSPSAAATIMEVPTDTLKAHLQADAVLNAMPLDEAVHLYMDTVVPA